MAVPAALRATLDAALAHPEPLDPALLRALSALPEAELDAALREFAQAHAAAALPVLTGLAHDRADRVVRRAAKRALYRLSQRGVAPPAPAATRPVVERREQRATRAWLSGIDGTGSRASWILFEDSWGGAALCSLIVNDTVGIVDVAGDAITKKRLERELASLRAAQKLPWIETEPARALGVVAEALALHRALGTSPPAAFTRWQPMFEDAAAGPAAPAPVAGDAALAARAAELLELPELAGWFLEPDAVQTEALELGALRESRLVVSDQIKAEREEALVARALERELPPEARRRWARRLGEMAHVFAATGRAEPAAIAAAAAATLADESRDVTRDPFARGLALRALEVAGEVAAGRLSAAEASRKPGA
jgi:hypothetical protein